eukprot:scaffold1314_cov393-Prasinococcus_capsulatus_cf.AAC.3
MENRCLKRCSRGSCIRPIPALPDGRRVSDRRGCVNAGSPTGLCLEELWARPSAQCTASWRVLDTRYGRQRPCSRRPTHRTNNSRHGRGVRAISRRWVVDPVRALVLALLLKRGRAGLRGSCYANIAYCVPSRLVSCTPSFSLRALHHISQQRKSGVRETVTSTHGRQGNTRAKAKLPQALEDILQIRSDGLERLGPELQLLMDVPKQLRTALIEGLHLVGCSRQVPQPVQRRVTLGLNEMGRGTVSHRRGQARRSMYARVVLTALQLRNLQALRDLKQQAAGLANIPLVVGLRTGSLAVSLRPLLPRGSIRPHVCVRAVHRSSGQVQGGERPAQCVVTVQPFVRTRLCVRRSIFSFTVHRLKALLEVPRDLLPVALGAFSHSLVA